MTLGGTTVWWRMLDGVVHFISTQYDTFVLFYLI